jgi:hypothetical protein
MLFLNETTLFLFNQRSSNVKSKGLIDKWAKEVQNKAQGSAFAKLAKSTAGCSVSSAILVISNAGKPRMTLSNSMTASSVAPTNSTVVDGINKLGGFEDKDKSYKREAVMSNLIKGNKSKKHYMYLPIFPKSILTSLYKMLVKIQLNNLSVKKFKAKPSSPPNCQVQELTLAQWLPGHQPLALCICANIYKLCCCLPEPLECC